MKIATLTADDGFALAMLGIIFLAMGVIGVLFLCMRRHAGQRDSHVDELLDEIEEDAQKDKLARLQGKPEKAAEPWEREGDWWKT